MEQMITEALMRGGPYALAVLGAASLIGAALYREDLIAGKRHRHEMAGKDLVIAEWKGIATKNTETTSTQAVQIKDLTETVATLTKAVQARR